MAERTNYKKQPPRYPWRNLSDSLNTTFDLAYCLWTVFFNVWTLINNPRANTKWNCKLSLCCKEAHADLDVCHWPVAESYLLGSVSCRCLQYIYGKFYSLYSIFLCLQDCACICLPSACKGSGAILKGLQKIGTIVSRRLAFLTQQEKWRAPHNIPRVTELSEKKKCLSGNNADKAPQIEH